MTPALDGSNSRFRVLVSTLLAAAVLLLLAPAAALAQESDEALSGSIPAPGMSGLLTLSAGATQAGILEALRAAACEPAVVATQTSAGWAAYHRGAPAFVNARFPEHFEADAPAFVRCLAAIDVVIPHESIALAGTLTLPPTAPPYPAVVLISGSGPQDRNEAIEGLPGYEPFRWIADHLQAAGVAVLRYDDRGVAQSTGRQEGATSGDFADDAEAVLEFLRRQPGIAPDRVGLAGHSEGGVIGGIVAERNADVAFVITLAGPGLDGDLLLDLQTRRILDVLGLPPEVVEAELAMGRLARELTLTGKWDELEALLRQVGEQQIAALPEEIRATIDLDEVIESQMLHHQTWLRFFLAHDPALDYARIDVPVLGIFGGLDLQVPAEENRAALEAALAGNEDATFVTLPEANHLFQAAITGSPEEYARLPMAFVPGLLETISEWILVRFGTAP